MEDPYRILGVSPDATNEEIRRQYITLVKQYHPDTGNCCDTERMIEINNAYDIIKNNGQHASNDPDNDLFTLIIDQVFGLWRAHLKDQSNKSYKRRRHRSS